MKALLFGFPIEEVDGVGKLDIVVGRSIMPEWSKDKFELCSTDKMTDAEVFQRAVKEFGEVSFKSIDIREYHDEQEDMYIYRVYKQKG